MAELKVRPLAFTRPDNIRYHWVDPALGLLSEESCEGARYLPFIIGSEPTESASCRSRQRGKIIDWFKALWR